MNALRAQLRDNQKRVKYALLNQPFQRCITGYFCSVCKPDYNLALTMGLHPRLGKGSPVAVLTGELVHMIVEMTKSKRKLPAFMSCSWNLNFAKRRRARAVLECSRAAKRVRDNVDTTTPQRPTQTAQETHCNRPRARVT
jgi:hypothetical protein